MNIKSKLRRGFEKAAPDVWGQVQGKLPQQKKTAAQKTPMNTQRKSPLWEALSTTAALAMAVVLVGGSLWMYLTYGPLRPSNPDPGLSAIPTDSTPPSTEPTEPPTVPPTEPSTEPTLPNTEPTQPPTEPATEPTLPKGYISEEEAITAAAEHFQVTDYQGECYLERRYIGDTDYIDRYVVTLDDGKYIYGALVTPNGGVYHAYCTPKEGTVYPDGPALPPAELTDEEFKNMYTIQYSYGKDSYFGGWPKDTKIIEVQIYPTDWPYAAFDGVSICTSGDIPVFQYKGKVYRWESDTVFTEIGFYDQRNGKLLFHLIDGEYEFGVGFECDVICVQYKLNSDEFYDALFIYESYDESICRLEISGYDSSVAKFFGKTENGEVELSPDVYRPGNK